MAVGADGASEGAARTGVFLRPLGAPLPLGFMALAVATFVVSGEQLGWIPESERRVVGLILLAAPLPLQLIASVLAFLARDGSAASALGVQGATWGAIGLVFVVAPGRATAGALGLLLLASGLHCTLTGLVTGTSKLIPGLVVFVTGVRFALTGVYQLSGTGSWQDAAGAVGLALAALATYAAVAMDVEDAKGRTLLPLLRRSIGKRSLEGGLPAQVEGVENEPGVRRRL